MEFDGYLGGFVKGAVMSPCSSPVLLELLEAPPHHAPLCRRGQAPGRGSFALHCNGATSLVQ